MNIKPTEEELRDMLDEGMSLYQISRNYNTRIPVIFQLERKYGMKSWSYKLKDAMTKKDIELMYNGERMNQKQIAQEIGCSSVHVGIMMNRYHISTRGGGKYNDQQRVSKSDEIIRLHDDEHLTKKEIAKRVGYSQSIVSVILHKHVVQARLLERDKLFIRDSVWITG